MAALNRHGVKYVIVGSTAAVFHGNRNVRQDLDLLSEATPSNADRVLFALSDLRLEHRWSSQDLCQPRKRLALQFHGVDLLTGVEGVTFEALYQDRIVFAHDAGDIAVASQQHIDVMARARCETRATLKASILVRLLDEGVDCWRPVDAIEERPGWYRIVGPIPDTEQWEFRPNQLVRCERNEANSLVAVMAAT